MKLFIMRHGPAEDSAATGLDSDRALTPKGRDRVRGVARALKDANELPSSILTSPLLRALQTASIVREELHLGQAPFDEHAWLGMLGRARELVDQLRAANAQATPVTGRPTHRDGVMIVGHEPELSSLVHGLTGEIVHMDKAMVVGVGFADSGPADPLAPPARLLFVFEPKTMVFRRP